MRRTVSFQKLFPLVIFVSLAGGCVDAFVEGLARGIADGTAVVVADFIATLPSADGTTE